jgi:hypothetical protein
MTSSAAISSPGGTVMPIAWAAFRLMTSPSLVACSNGVSAGLASLRMRSTRAAPRRKIAGKSDW